jgi:hypothetical protein
MKLTLLLSLLLSLPVFSQDFNVHEWGTFTSLVGSNGVRQNGMFHEDEVLPSFVHNFGDLSSLPKLSLKAFNEFDPTPVPRPIPRPCGHSKVGCDFLENQDITQKMETPVLYFHSKTARNVIVDVGFPAGIISQTYPAPTMSFPEAIPGVKLTNGFARFNVDVLTHDQVLPVVENKNIYAYARNVAANTIVSNHEAEKFIFYRGLGAFETKLFITSQNGNLKVVNTSKNSIPSVFVVDSDVSGGAIQALGELKAGQNLVVSDKNLLDLKNHHQGSAEFSESAKKLMLNSLVSNGLNTDEALAMLNTWEHGYFKTKGLRVLYVLNRNEVESILPMTITPSPAQLNRVFVGRIEVLLDTEENDILQKVVNEKTSFDITTLGRFAPNILSRIHDLARDRKVLTPELELVFEAYNKIIALIY